MAFYKITKQQAEQIGKINYENGKQFDPFVGEQKDGKYLVEDKMYDLLKERTEIKKVDFVAITKITNVDFKPVSINPVK